MSGRPSENPWNRMKGRRPGEARVDAAPTPLPSPAKPEAVVPTPKLTTVEIPKTPVAWGQGMAQVVAGASAPPSPARHVKAEEPMATAETSSNQVTVGGAPSAWGQGMARVATGASPAPSPAWHVKSKSEESMAIAETSSNQVTVGGAGSAWGKGIAQVATGAHTRPDGASPRGYNKRVEVHAAMASPKGSPHKGQRELTSGMSKFKLSDVKSSPRPRRNFDKVAVSDSSEIRVLANHFNVDINKQTFPAEIFHYDVVIQSAEGRDCRIDTTELSTLPDRILPVIWHEFERVHAQQLNAATPFDQKKNCYTARRLSFDGQDCFSTILSMRDPDDPDKNRRFRITIKLVSQVPTEAFWKFMRSGKSLLPVELPQDVIQALDVALRYSPSLLYTPCNRSFFSDTGAKRLDNTLDLWYGHYQSLSIGCNNSATLNFDVATKAFYKKMSLKAFITYTLKLNEEDSFDLSYWDDASILAAGEAFKGKLIQYGTGEKRGQVHEKYHRFTAVALKMESSLSYSFKSGNGTLMTIREYMRDVKNTAVEFPHYPVVHIGSRDKTNYVPLELCWIIPQAYRGKMEANLTKEMIKGAAVSPVDRFKRIKIARDGCKLEKCNVLKEFGLVIGQDMIEIKDAKRLHPPKIRTKSHGKIDSGTQVNPTEGKWQYGSGPNQRQFVEGVRVPQFAVLFATKGGRQLTYNINAFLDQLSRSGESLGMTGFRDRRIKVLIEFMSEVTPGSQYSTEAASKLDRMKRQGIEFVVVIIGDEGKEYASIKAEAEVRVGILTACIKLKNVTSPKNQTIGNYLLKLNSKLNGVNFSVGTLESRFFKEPIIIFGADVTHPAPNSKSPSIAAVTASYNKSGMGFNMHIQPQSSRQEVIDNLGDIVEKMIKDFRIKTGSIPKKLVMFRDGVSEGYFDEIKVKEFEEIRKVCEALSPAETIKITFVVVKKRHHTRLQPTNSKDGVGRFGNVPPGTVVDTVIVHPAEQEFFLNSHVGIQGTSKPTRYHIIHDDNLYTMGDIQKMTYYLCYTFVRCTQPVSYPAATYYAHLAAYRARSLIERDGETADLSSLQRQLTIHPDLLHKYPMFYV